jgi:type VI secretion system protein ImpK
MTHAEVSSPSGGVPAAMTAGRRGQLALALQEAFTVAGRLRANRQVATSADAFREQIKALLGSADRDARRIGYSGEDVRLAIYAYIAFLDETVLRSSQPMFQGWTRKPLQEEVFGDHVAGETFFRNLDGLMARQDSEEVADVLEVYLLCLLLGFRGRFAANPEGIETAVSRIRERLHRIRGGGPVVGPDGRLPGGESPSTDRDPWLRRLLVAAAVIGGVAVLLFVAFRLSLGSAARDLQALAAGLLP